MCVCVCAFFKAKDEKLENIFLIRAIRQRGRHFQGVKMSARPGVFSRDPEDKKEEAISKSRVCGMGPRLPASPHPPLRVRSKLPEGWCQEGKELAGVHHPPGRHYNLSSTRSWTQHRCAHVPPRAASRNVTFQICGQGHRVPRLHSTDKTDLTPRLK